MLWTARLCRICAQIGEISHPILENDVHDRQIAEKIKKILHLDVHRDDYKPKEICSHCLLKLNDFHEFMVTCQTANEKFEAMLYNYDRQGRYPSQKSGVIVPSKTDGDGLADCSDIIMMVQYKGSNSFLPLDPLNEQDVLNAVSNVEPGYARKKTDMYQQNQTVLRHSGDVRDNNYYSQKDYYYAHQNSGCGIETTIFDASAYNYTADIPPESDKSKHGKVVLSVEDVCKSVKDPPEKAAQPPNCTQNKAPPKLYVCPTCNKSFSKKASLGVHTSSHTNIRPYACQLCPKTFAVQWELTSHQKIHTGAHKCQFCPKTFSVRSKLERHERTHTNERPFACRRDGCGRRFSDKRNLIAHEATHSGVRDFTCDVCQKSYKTKSHMNDHKRAHAEASFKCELCGAEYKWKANLVMHMKKHGGYRCGYCKEDCGKLGALIKHRKACGNKKR